MYILKLFSIMLTQMRSNAQQVERTNGLTNFNPIYGLRDHHLSPSYILFNLEHVFVFFLHVSVSLNICKGIN